MKKLLSILSVTALIIGSLAGFKVFAAENPPLSLGKEYISSDGLYKYAAVKNARSCVRITGVDEEKFSEMLNENKGAFAVPKTIDGYYVGAIGKNSLKGNSCVKKLIIPKNSSVSEIKPNAFKNCKMLEAVELNGLEEIYDSAFENCTSLKKVFMPNVLVISDAAFKNCKKLASVKFNTKEAYLEIHNKAFYGCTSLKSVKLNENTTMFPTDEQKAFGYYYDKKSQTEKRIQNFTINILSDPALKYSLSLKEYARDNGIKTNYLIKSGENNTISVPAGASFNILVNGKKVKWRSADTDFIKFTKNGEMIALGGYGNEVDITAKKDGKKITRGVLILTGVGLIIDKFDDPDTPKTLYVKKGSTNKAKIIGKSYLIDNKITCSDDKIAKVISKKSSPTVTVRGLKKGESTVRIKVNGVYTIKLKVKVV